MDARRAVPAFPGSGALPDSQRGITKLEFFAAAALPECARQFHPADAARLAFDYAAAMLAESERRSK